MTIAATLVGSWFVFCTKEPECSTWCVTHEINGPIGTIENPKSGHYIALDIDHKTIEDAARTLAQGGRP